MGYIVRTLVDGVEVDSQTVDTYDELQDNSFVTFDLETELDINGGDVFSGGTDGTVNGEAHQKAREIFESVSFNILAVPSKEKEIQDAYIEYVKRLRDEGQKFQIVLPAINRETKINYEGVIEYANRVTNPIVDAQTDLCYWVAGAEAGCKVQNSCTAKEYDGQFTISAKVTRAEQRKALQNGQILFHSVGDTVVILRDINTLTKINKGDVQTKHKDFGTNQVVRVLDGIVMESAEVFNSMFLGKRANTLAARTELRNQLLKIREHYETISAIDTYDPTQLVINPGQKPNEVVGRDAIRPLQAMDTLYLEITYISE